MQFNFAKYLYRIPKINQNVFCSKCFHRKFHIFSPAFPIFEMALKNFWRTYILPGEVFTEKKNTSL